MFRAMKELTGPDTAPALLELSMWPPYATPRPLQFTSVEKSVGLVREGPKLSDLGGSLWVLKHRAPGGIN